MSTIVKNTSIYTLANILPQAVAFILLPIYTKYLSPAEYGIVNAMTVFQAVLVVFYTLNLDRGIIRLFWDHQADEKVFLGTITLSIVTTAVVFSLLTIILSDEVNLLFKEIEFYPYFLMTIVTTFSTTFSLVPKNYFRLKNEALKYFSVSAIELLVSTIAILYFIIIDNGGALGVILGKMISAVSLLPIYVFIIWRRVVLRFDISIFKSILKFTLPIFPSLVSAWLIGQADRVFIASYLTLSEVGIYSLSKRIAGLVSIISGAFTMAYHPIFFEISSSSDSRSGELVKINNMFINGLLLIGFLISLVSEEVIILLLDAKYSSSNIYISSIVFSYIIGSLSSTILGAYLQQSKKMHIDMIVSVTGGLVTVIMFFILIPIYGLWGAVMASMLSTIFIFLVLYLYLKHKTIFYPFPWRSILLNLFPIIVVYFFFQILDLKLSYYSLMFKLLIWLGLVSMIFLRKKTIIFIKNILFGNIRS